MGIFSKIKVGATAVFFVVLAYLGFKNKLLTSQKENLEKEVDIHKGNLEVAKKEYQAKYTNKEFELAREVSERKVENLSNEKITTLSKIINEATNIKFKLVL